MVKKILMTKEDYLHKHLGHHLLYPELFEPIEKAMQEYADQEAIEFRRWTVYSNVDVSVDLYKLYLEHKNKIMSNTEMELINKAIHEQIKETAIKFKEWQDENLEDKKWETYDGCDRWINPHTREVKSTQQLYEIFESQSK